MGGSNVVFLDIHVGVTVLDDFKDVPRSFNLPVLDLNRQVGHLKDCYKSKRSDLADLFTRQKNFFVEKNVDVDEFEVWIGCLYALKGQHYLSLILICPFPLSSVPQGVYRNRLMLY
uniref:Uncharacterized protein n=1 Tax=Meloidogyne javanica TaxID=6303 RepID=A0A915MY10_MELJA